MDVKKRFRKKINIETRKNVARIKALKMLNKKLSKNVSPNLFYLLYNA